jgi:hypothetical protein
VKATAVNSELGDSEEADDGHWPAASKETERKRGGGIDWR